MNVSVRERSRHTYQLSQKLGPAYRDRFSDVAVYLRTSTMDEAAAEEAIEDVLEMLLAAQDRGEPAQCVLGEDVSRFCAEIVASAGASLFTRKQALNQLTIFFMCAASLWTVDLAQNVLRWMLRGMPFKTDYSFTLAALAHDLLGYGLVTFMFYYIGRHVKSARITGRNRVTVGAVLVLLLSLQVMVRLWMPSYILWNTSIFVMAACFTAVIWLSVWLKKKM